MKPDKLAAALPSAVTFPLDGGDGTASTSLYAEGGVAMEHVLTRCVDGSASGATFFGMMELRVTHEPKPSQTLEYAPPVAVLHGKPWGAFNVL